MVEPRFRWLLPEAFVPSNQLLERGRELGLTDRTVELLGRRGITEPDELTAFFAEPLEGLHDPRLLPDADRIIARLRRARDLDETVLVFGDFDADGLTGLTILVLALRRFGILVAPYVPSRLDEGHGLSRTAVERAAEIGARVIVTVDTGSTSVEEVRAAGELGIDVLITDHHRVPAEPPPAVALVNPHRPDATYPDRRLAGSGVAFKVAQLLLADEPGGPAAALELADLATIGTVADLAPVLGENRAIARLGLVLLRTAPRPGVAALLAAAGIAADAVDLETIAFSLAPRLNAASRVGEAADAAKLLLTDDPDEAAALAATLDTANLTRRDLTKQAVAEARALVVADTADGLAATVVRGPWPVGIVGLVASKLVEDSGRPAIVGAVMGDIVRASCRSATIDLAATLEGCADLLIRFGGHPGAAGFELPSERWDTFVERFLMLAGAAAPIDQRPALRIDLALAGRAVDYPLFHDLARLGPTGPGHPEPLLAVLGLTVARLRPATGGHTQITLRRDPDVLDGIAFGREDLLTSLAEGDRVDVVARLASRSFGGYESLQLEVRDVAPAGSLTLGVDGSAHEALPVEPIPVAVRDTTLAAIVSDR